MRSMVPPATIRPIKGGVSITLPILPVPASRPRVTRWGVYYGKKYTRYMKDAAESLGRPEDVKLPFGPPLFHPEASVSADLVFALPPYKTVKRDDPPGDIDNHIKAVLDAINKWGAIWADDRQVVHLVAVKRFCRDGENPHTKIRITAA